MLPILNRPRLLVMLAVLLVLGRPVTTMAEATRAQAKNNGSLSEHGGPVKGVAVSADGQSALTASFDYSLILWDLNQGSARAHLYGHDAAVNDVAFLPGDTHAISVSDDGTVGLWDLVGEQLIERLHGHGAKVAAVAVSADGKLAATAAWDHTVRVWDLASRTEVQVLDGGGNLNTVHFDATGERLFAGGSDGSIRAWRVADGNQLMAVQHHGFGVTKLALTPDGATGVSASIDETVQLWRSADGTPVAELFGHDGPVLAVAISPDGDLVASGGVDGTVRVWRRGDGDRLRVYARHHGPVWAVAFAPDGASLLSGGADGLVLIYDLDQEPEAGELELAKAAAVEDGADTPTGRGAALFKTCVACHTVTADGGHRAGPTLYGLFGRTAGRVTGYPYSGALTASNLVWSEATIDQLFDLGPENLIPGSKMPLQRMPNPDDRRQLIAYLKQITASGGTTR